MASDNIVCGLHAVLSVLQNRPQIVTDITVDAKRNDKRIEQIVLAAKQAGITVNRSLTQSLDKQVGADIRHQGVLARIRDNHEQADIDGFIDTLGQDAFLLVLDGIQDPHNLGACLRSAGAAGVQAVFMPKDRSASLTPVARRAASGAAEILPIYQVSNLARTLGAIKEKGVWLIGTADDSKDSVYQADLTGPLAFIMGSEGRGMRRLTRELCDSLVNIPMSGSVSSLNVSVATGVCLFEAVRQRGK